MPNGGIGVCGQLAQSLAAEVSYLDRAARAKRLLIVGLTSLALTRNLRLAHPPIALEISIASLARGVLGVPAQQAAMVS